VVSNSACAKSRRDDETQRHEGFGEGGKVVIGGPERSTEVLTLTG
jgi:hypothetical protein